MDKLLTQKDLAERWQVSIKAIESYRQQGIITPIKGIPSIRFNPQHIAEIEETKLEKFSPIERRKIERENEELRRKLEISEGIITKMQMVINEAIYMKAKET